MEVRLTELNENEILLYLGYRGQEYPAEVEVQIKRCEKEVLAAAVPRLIWRRLPVEEVHSCGLPPESRDIRDGGCGDHGFLFQHSGRKCCG